MSNCVLWAIGQWIKCGGYIAIRRTRHRMFGLRGLWPHMLWSQDTAVWYAYVPLSDRRNWITRLTGLPPIVFRGYVRQDW